MYIHYENKLINFVYQILILVIILYLKVYFLLFFISSNALLPSFNVEYKNQKVMLIIAMVRRLKFIIVFILKIVVENTCFLPSLL